MSQENVEIVRRLYEFWARGASEVAWRPSIRTSSSRWI